MLPVHCLTRSISCRSAAYSPYNNVNLSFINFHERLRTSYRILFRHYRLASSAQQWLFHHQRGPFGTIFSLHFFPSTFFFLILPHCYFLSRFSNYSSSNSSFLSSFPLFTLHIHTSLLYSFSFHFSFLPFHASFLTNSTIPLLILSFMSFY